MYVLYTFGRLLSREKKNAPCEADGRRSRFSAFVFVGGDVLRRPALRGMINGFRSQDAGAVFRFPKRKIPIRNQNPTLRCIFIVSQSLPFGKIEKSTRRCSLSAYNGSL